MLRLLILVAHEGFLKDKCGPRSKKFKHHCMRVTDPWVTTTYKSNNEKGASSWLSALPIKAIGYALNKQEFMDGICMRYGWNMKCIPTHFACEETNSVDHSLICKLGGYTSMRHNSVRDSEAQIVKDVCSVEMFRQNTHFYHSTKTTLKRVNTAYNARLDISARGTWNSCDKTFEIRITHPTKSLAEIYPQHRLCFYVSKLICCSCTINVSLQMDKWNVPLRVHAPQVGNPCINLYCFHRILFLNVYLYIDYGGQAKGEELKYTIYR